jgi:multidrug efflux pump subunit AcrA (membrane-fusion protein)
LEGTFMTLTRNPLGSAHGLSSRIPLHWALIFLLAALGPTPGRAEDEKEGGSTVPTSETQAMVKTVPLREGTLPLTLHVLGRVGSTRQTPAVIMALSGGAVSRIAVRDGQRVTSGTVLLCLDARAAQAELRKAQAELTLAERELRYGDASGLAQQQEELDLAARQGQVKAEQAQREAERLGKLLGKALVSEKAATVARQEAETARREAEAAVRKAELFKRSGKALELDRLRAKVDEARAAARLAELELEAMTVRAPLAGRVTRVHVAAGQLVEKGAALVELEASQGVGASFALAPALAARVRPAMAFLLHDEATSRSFRGTIIAVGGGLDADSGLVRVEGVLELAGGAAPFLGETLVGEIITGRSPRGMIVPETALSVTDEGAAIHVVDGGQKAHATPVKVVATGGGEALVQGGGLKAGQPVVSDGNYNLPDGAGIKQERS